MAFPVLGARGSLQSDLPSRAPQNFIIRWDQAISQGLQTYNAVQDMKLKHEEMRLRADMQDENIKLKRAQAAGIKAQSELVAMKAQELKGFQEFGMSDDAKRLRSSMRSGNADDFVAIRQQIQDNPLYRSNSTIMDQLEQMETAFSQGKAKEGDQIVDGWVALGNAEKRINERAVSKPSSVDLAKHAAILKHVSENKSVGTFNMATMANDDAVAMTMEQNRSALSFYNSTAPQREKMARMKLDAEEINTRISKGVAAMNEFEQDLLAGKHSEMADQKLNIGLATLRLEAAKIKATEDGLVDSATKRRYRALGRAKIGRMASGLKESLETVRLARDEYREKITRLDSKGIPVIPDEAETKVLDNFEDQIKNINAEVNDLMSWAKDEEGLEAAAGLTVRPSVMFDSPEAADAAVESGRVDPRYQRVMVGQRERLYDTVEE